MRRLPCRALRALMGHSGAPPRHAQHRRSPPWTAAARCAHCRRSGCGATGVDGQEKWEPRSGEPGLSAGRTRPLEKGRRSKPRNNFSRLGETVGPVATDLRHHTKTGRRERFMHLRETGPAGVVKNLQGRHARCRAQPGYGGGGADQYIQCRQHGGGAIQFVLLVQSLRHENLAPAEALPVRRFPLRRRIILCADQGCRAGSRMKFRPGCQWCILQGPVAAALAAAPANAEYVVGGICPAPAKAPAPAYLCSPACGLEIGVGRREKFCRCCRAERAAGCPSESRHWRRRRLSASHNRRSRSRH